MRYLLLSVVLLVVGCPQRIERIENDKVRDELIMTCQNTGEWLWRCENSEVICYRYGEALQCYFKASVDDYDKGSYFHERE